MYKTPAERMAVSLRREEAEATGKPLYKSYSDVPGGLLGATACKRIKKAGSSGRNAGSVCSK